MSATLRGLRAAAGGIALTMLSSAMTQTPAADHVGAAESDLQMWRASGNIRLQRRHVWDVLMDMTRESAYDSQPRFESWHGEDEVFADKASNDTRRGIRGFARVTSALASRAADGEPATQAPNAPIVTYTLYNDAAYRHMRANHLYLRATLNRLRVTGEIDRTVPGDRAIPPFPPEAVILKTAWWPVARHSITAMPVWDPQENPARNGGNDYTTWQRVIGIDPSKAPASQRSSVNFAGRTFDDVVHVGLERFHYVVVDARMSRALMRDRDSSKAIMIALGRRLMAGDYLVAVGGSLATREVGDWIWATFWWHDRPTEGPFASDRPQGIEGAWRNYLLQVAFDESTPMEADGGPHICFNPWLEARFPDGGRGGGTQSNCLACHRRASYPPVDFLPVTRGDADLTNDPAYASGRLRTSLLWSVAMHAKPESAQPQ